MLNRVRAIAGGVVATALAISTFPARADGGVAFVEVNGVAFAVTERTLRAGPEQAAHALQAHWRRETPQAWIALERVGDRRIVARRLGALHETASFRPANARRGSRAVISVLDTTLPPRPLPQPPTGLPAGSRWLSSVRTPAETAEATIEWVAITDRPVAAAHRAWVAALRRAGWREQTRAGGAHALFRREGQAISLHLQPSGRQTTVVVQWRRTTPP
jgi:hypothetical protein